VVRKADVSNEGTARSAAWRLPEAEIVKGVATPLTRTPAAALLKLPKAWRAEPSHSYLLRRQPATRRNLMHRQKKRGRSPVNLI